MIRIGSLFSGYGGLDMGVAAALGADARTAWVSEIDKAACTVLDARTDAVNLGDVTRINWNNVPPIDVLTAGYPCQPFSVAGHRKGTDDPRHLWPHAAHAIRVLRPRLVVLENVAGHLRLGFPDVLADLAGLGFDAEWTVARASDVGAPHQRARLFVVAWPADAAGSGCQGGEPAGRRLVPPREAPDADAPGFGRRGARRAWGGRTGPADGRGQVAADADGQGRGVVGRLHPVGRDADRRRGPNRPRPAAEPTPWGHAAADASRVARQGPGQPASGGPEPEDLGTWGPYTTAIQRWETVIGRPAPPPTAVTTRSGQGLSARFVEWMMGLPAGWVTDLIPRRPALRVLGNGVVPQQATHAIRTLLATSRREAA